MCSADMSCQASSGLAVTHRTVSILLLSNAMSSQGNSPRLGFGLWGLGLGAWGLGLGVRGLGLGVWGLGFGVWGLGFEFRI